MATGFNINAFVKGSPEEKNLSIVKEIDVLDNPSVTKKPAKRKKKDELSDTIKSSPSTIVPETSMSYIQQNIPYATAYQETNAQLDESIMQLNALGGELMSELKMVRSSKTLRNKYNLVNDMTETATTIINAKIAAIKEKNKTINDVNHLELTRLKELKTSANEEDDNIRIANMYDAFVNTPIGGGPASLAPPMQEMIMSGGGPDIARMAIGDDHTAWEQSLNPAQNRMLLEARGNIETVVMYDETTGNRWFEVVDKQTRQPVPNVEKPDNSYIYDLDINIRGGFAKDSNRNTTYPLIVINGGDSSITEY
jgi:hypothetical protein